MERIDFNSLSNEDKTAIFTKVAEEKRITAFAVEKDWWVVQILLAVFQLPWADKMVFKGGTSLSKAWRLIDRFSEDIDLAIDRQMLGFEGDLSRKQITELRKRASVFTEGEFLKALESSFKESGRSVDMKMVDPISSDQDPRIIEVYYPNIIESPGYLQPRVQIEIGCRSLLEPFTSCKISTLIDEVYPDREFTQDVFAVPAVNPQRTFLEKIFLLHEEFQRPSEKRRVDRLSRHIYDVVKMIKEGIADQALADPALYETIVKHRYTFTRLGGVNYNLHQPATINPLPPPELTSDWRADYQSMLEQMIYEHDPLSYDQLIDELSLFQQKINALTWTFNQTFPSPDAG